jgi:uncharacterized protein (TIGR00251 family)
VEIAAPKYKIVLFKLDIVMKILEKQAGNSFLLHVNVKPNSKKQNIQIDGGFLRIQIRSKALQNKANKELLNLLKNKLKIPSNHIQLISGLKSTNKVIQLIFSTEVDEDVIIKKLLA